MGRWLAGWFLYCCVLGNVAAGQLSAPPASQMNSEMLKQLNQAYIERYGKPVDGDKSRFINRLILQRAPYLQRHATNPINWQTWSDDAFKQAAQSNKLIFLSIGYSTCHWCHVMEQDSFVKTDIAELLNSDYISIKVDRETLPAVDEIYTAALNLVKGTSGWPITAILNAKGEPLFIESFLPHQKLKQLLLRMSGIWPAQAEFLNLQAQSLMTLVKQQQQLSHSQPWDGKALSDVQGKVLALLDKRHGGFTGAQKFPQEAALLLLLDNLAREDNRELSDLVTLQLEQMAGKGLFDHVHGGFHRYSTDSQWLVPHYEKMLYNQGQLLLVYSRAYGLQGKPGYKAVLEQTIGFLNTWMFDKRHGFYSAIDAVYQGEEGKYYHYTESRLKALGAKLSAEAGLQTYQYEQSGRFGVYFEKATSEAAAQIRRELSRVHGQTPYIDKKVITAWNALTIWGLTEANLATGNKQALWLAEQTAERLWQAHFDNDKQQLARASIDGHTHTEGTLEDYAYLTMAMLRLHQVSGEQSWHDRAARLAKIVLNRFVGENNVLLFQPRGMQQSPLSDFSKTVDGEMLSPSAVMLSAFELLYQSSGETLFKTAMKQTQQNLQLHFSAQPLNHLYTAKVLGDIELGSFHATQYFAFGKGIVTLATGAFDSACRSTLQVRLSDGWHINSDKPLQPHLRPTRVALTPELPQLHIQYPKDEKVALSFQREPLSIYHGDIDISLTGENHGAGRLTVDLQACSDKVCLLPQKRRFYLPQCR